MPLIYQLAQSVAPGEHISEFLPSDQLPAVGRESLERMWLLWRTLTVMTEVVYTCPIAFCIIASVTVTSGRSPYGQKGLFYSKCLIDS